MNDNAAKGLENARQTGQLRKDADVHKRSSSIGKRNSGSGLSGGSSSSSLTSSLSNRSIRGGVNSSSFVNRDAEAKRRLNNQNKIHKAIEIAEKIPVARKYAKIAKIAEKVKGAKSKSFGKSFLGQSEPEPTNAEIEDANAADVKGEEYNPDDTRVRFTGGLEKRERMILIGVLGGILLSSVFLCIILVSAITGGGKESFLASDNRVDNVTEADIEEAYNKDEANESSGSNNESSNSSSDSSSSNPSSNQSNSNANDSFASLLSAGGITTDTLNERNTNQLIIVNSSGSSATVYFYEKTNNQWKNDSDLTASGYVGSSGTTDSPSEGKSATPKGLYSVGDAFYQSDKPNTKLNSFKITENTYWVDDPDSKYYNMKVEGNSNKDWDSAEHMSEIGSYKYGFVINYNMNPIKKGAGSAIFFHISHGSPTAGCVSVSEDKVLSYLSKLDKSKNPYILII